MKRIALAAALAVLFSIPVLSQAQGEKPAAAKPAAPMKPAAKADKAAAPMKAEAKAAKPAATPAPATRKRSRAREDARDCLKFPTNLEIHKCAEQYR